MKIAYIADAQCNHGHKWIQSFSQQNEVILICQEGSNLHTLYANKNFTIYPVLPATYPLRDWRKRNKTIRILQDIMDKHSIDLIHAMYAVPYGFWAYQTGTRPYVITTRGSDMLIDYSVRFQNAGPPAERIRNYLLRKLTASALQKASAITSTSMKQQKVIRTLVSKQHTMSLIRTGVDTTAFTTELEAVSRRTTDSFHIFSNRAMAPLYNIHLIIQAFDKLIRKIPTIQFHLTTIDYYGNKEYRNEIESLIQTLNLQEKVTILDAVEMPQLAKLYKNSDLILMLPSSDGTPVSGIEAMLAKKPIIIGPLEYDKDLFNKETVWSVGSFSVDELSEKIAEVVSSQQDMVQKKCEQAYRNAIELADFNKEIKKMDDIYTLLI
jgi:glycosyltransferase involved in cell wall biosynthesis